MAAILDAMGPYVMQLIADMATEEVKMLLGISGDIEKLENNMESIKCFLADAERQRINEVRVQRWVQMLKNAMYDATDILDLCQIEADKQRESKGSSTDEKAPGCCRPLLSCLRNPVFAHKIGNRIKELNQRLDNIYKEAHKFNFVINLGSHPEQIMSTSEKMTSEFVESAIVGEKIERETRELAQMLTINGHHDIKVVAIVGTGGMGKTTLAQKIFNETTVQGHFKVKIWLSITQHFDEVELLRTAIEHAGGAHGGVQDKTLLSRKLTNTLSMGRFLLVHGTDHLKVVGMKIISKCGGLPLAIKVMGGLLSTKPRSEGDWEAVLKHHAWSVARLPKELDNAIYLSYEDLSPQLKQCFLYCSLFPKEFMSKEESLVVQDQQDDGGSKISHLLHLRTLSMYGSHDNVLIPKGFGQLKNLRTLYGFRVHLDKNGGTGWCSLEEIGPLSQLRELTLHGLENVPASSSAGMAMVSSKEHLDYLELHWSSSGFMGLRDETNKQQRQRVVEEVIEVLSPPSSIRHLSIEGYFGSRLPNWMMVPATCVFKSLRLLRMDKLCCCTQLPDGLCQLPSLESLAINDAPAIKSVGPEFQSPSSLPVGGGIVTTGSVVGFPNLATLRLAGLCEWEEWEWEEQGEDATVNAMAMPALKKLIIINCKLSCLPPGLASRRRHALREVLLYKLSNLTYIENFPSVVKLDVFDCPELRRISNLSKLQKIEISYCPNMEVLEGVPSLDSMEMEDGTMETVPEYVTTVRPRYLKLTCSKRLYESLLTGSSSEYDKISHIKSRTICAEDED
ncbi:putative disease resistance protein RGA4 [Miscanthus floridulus]|uniref:putative disease resistance protein RGA4 n=1 Tax=Miscanthus floridulus TaxID=154761 RepID=UPI00345A828D